AGFSTSTSLLGLSGGTAGDGRGASRHLKAGRPTPPPSSGTLRSTLAKNNRMTNPKTTEKPKRPDLDALERTSPNSRAPLHEHKCELGCPNCAYFKSCSDF